ncbi:hypothetical protein TrLO_g2712 [Triparma laevis f. longispina]|uniref:3'(2'),5'-bisphosphate nucleotidase n=1 Tax=Triparma laevis f. longispina TaxID=1714387 RepID=A0A9W6Z875_9STRA|nr:hypothetical protein TrLO_g2712 [Triparma laevis f. longispina]
MKLTKSLKTGDDRSVVTQADINAQKIIVSQIREHYPQIHIIAEEDPSYIPPHLSPPSPDSHESGEYPSNSILIYVDPLDGTREYLLGNVENVLCLIGVTTVHNKILGGVMRAPFGRTFISYSSELYEDIDNMLIPFTPPPPSSLTLKICSSGSSTLQPILDKLRTYPNVEIDIIGGAGNKISRVIQGNYDVALFNDRTSLWDTAATSACLIAGDGKVIDFYGKELIHDPPINLDGLLNYKGVIGLREGLDVAEVLGMMECEGMKRFRERNEGPFCTGCVSDSIVQPTYICMTCSPPQSGNNNCFCPACAVKCHSKCEVMYVGNLESGCDCRALGCCGIWEGGERVKRCFESLGGGLKPTPPSDEPGDSPDVTNFSTFKSYTTSNLPPTLTQSCLNLVKKTKETFFLPYPFTTPPLTDMESYARDVFNLHTQNLDVGPSSGAEFWCQVKPTSSDSSIDLHYDKDEYLSENFTLGSFPLKSTVTYLTASRQPTVIFDHCYEDREDEVIKEARVCYPRRGKHVVFNGKLLHGAVDEEEFRGFYVGEEMEEDVRVTFLVNVWVNSRPAIESLSEEDRSLIGPASDNASDNVEFVEDSSRQIVEIGGNNLAGEGIMLPFVGAGETWEEEGGEEGEEEGLVLAMPSLPGKGECDNVVIKFEEGYEARLVYVGGGYEEDEEMEDIEEGEEEVVEK